MSRNLCRTDCYFCRGDVELLEEPHPMEREYSRYWADCQGQQFAKARCLNCWSEYLAWMSPRPCDFEQEPGTIFDLSFYSTFNDEPGVADHPKRKAIWVLIDSVPQPKTRKAYGGDGEHGRWDL